MNFSIIAISSWLKQCIIKSAVMKNKDIHIIHPCVDTKIYRPMEKKIARDLFLLPKNKKLILFGAVHSTSDPRKGYKYLIEALKKLENKVNQKDEFELVVFGATNSGLSEHLKTKVHYLGRLKSGYGLHDDASLAALYSLADVTIAPSLQEAFGQIAIESMACGTPVIGFSETGLEDIISHKVDGYLAKRGSSNDLSMGLQWIFEHSNYNQLSSSSSKKIKKMFSYNKSSKLVINLYKKIIGNK
tara:strand:- start:4609 stop:5340 length:732 start_codon:yes stop_codon:yes gene_type:complete